MSTTSFGDDPALAAERRLVTAVFADLFGYTTLAHRLDPERLVEVVDPIIAALTEVVYGLSRRRLIGIRDVP